VESHQRNAAGCEQRAGKLRRPRPLVRNQRRQTDREERLHLNHQRRQPRGHADRDAGERKRELQREREQPVRCQMPPRRARPRNEDERWECREREAQAGQRQRRHVVQAPADDDEIESPDRHHDRGSSEMQRLHAPL
jgi:hypothetical protein